MGSAFLVCPPTHFALTHRLNPWMQGEVADPRLAQIQWERLMRTLAACGADLRTLTPLSGLADQCFVANTALVYGTVAVPARFAHPGRIAEEAPAAEALSALGYTLAPLPEDLYFEGEGDALVDSAGVVWTSYGFRTPIQTHWSLGDILAGETRSLLLVDPRFFQLDLCFCPLPGGHLLWYPPAFDGASQVSITSHFPEARRHAVHSDDALRLACNALCVGRTVVLNQAGERLRGWLSDRGFAPLTVEVDAFVKAGGAVKALALTLSADRAR